MIVAINGYAWHDDAESWHGTRRLIGMVFTTTTRTRLVLVVEDDEPIGELLAGVINDEEGYRAIHVTRPTDALHTLAQMKPDLLVLDVGLPGMNGFELYDRVHQDERLKNVPVIFATALSREHAAQFRERGIRYVLQKPFDLNDLIADVKKLVPPIAA
jgi:DNA-binding response OmpR family regulator